MLIVVVDRQGSSPGKQGFKMAVAADGGLAGSIGGGVMEFQMVEMAKKKLAEKQEQATLKRQVHDPAAGDDHSGLICSGEQTHAFVPLEPGQEETIRTIIRALDEGVPGRIILMGGGLSFREEGSDPGERLGGDVAESDRPGWSQPSGGQWTYFEPCGRKPCLYIFGGGHVSLPLSRVFRMLGFRVIVFDDREGLNTMASNDIAHEKRVIDYRDAGSLIPEGLQSYVAIMTVSHATDQLILKQLLQKQLKYLGMIGSRKKVQKIFEALEAEGASDEDLKMVDAPMGLAINSVTPEEIAISIAARVIQIKNA